MFQPFNGQCSHYIKTSKLIFTVNQLPGFCMMGTLVVKRLMELQNCNRKLFLRQPQK